LALGLELEAPLVHILRVVDRVLAVNDDDAVVWGSRPGGKKEGSLHICTRPVAVDERVHGHVRGRRDDASDERVMPAEVGEVGARRVALQVRPLHDAAPGHGRHRGEARGK